LKGLRYIHVHLDDSPLSRDDLTDLSLLRLDLMAAICCRSDGLPGRIHWAHLLPPNPERKTVEVATLPDIGRFDINPRLFLPALEAELTRTIGGPAEVFEAEERALLIAVSGKGRAEIEDSLDELEELARTAGVQVMGREIQRSSHPNPKYLLGEGKLKEVVIEAMGKGAGLLIFDQNLSPGQVRSISALTEIKVIDRTQLILDIFAKRAHTLDGKVQVELAQLKYLLPHLTGKGAAMSRLMGGVGGRGPGETKLEMDRRRIRDRIARLEKELKGLSQGRMQRRSLRAGAAIPIISIVGYTNAGKSTLLNVLTGSETFTENLLFATLDTATRRLRFPREREVIITDTVGFIRDLPESLFGAFKATLEELKDADLLLHLVDLSHPRFEAQIAAVDKILQELHLHDKPRLLVFNKIDRVPPEEIAPLSRRFGAIPIAARDRASLRPLLEELESRFWPRRNDGEPEPSRDRSEPS
ncbi:MAG: GTPase HflX, partial [Deltaproteobacteria bacterium]|nr:GTPase HflX [Deltaproteobacteria bacterium]